VAAVLGTLLLKATEANAWINITYPAADAILKGTVTVTASVNGDYWSQLVVDGKPLASSSTGSVSFSWNTASFKDGVHQLTVKGYAKGRTVAQSAQTISVNVLNGATSAPAHFSTLREPLCPAAHGARSRFPGNPSWFPPTLHATTRCRPGRS
jgi:hypothetical protein